MKTNFQWSQACRLSRRRAARAKRQPDWNEALRLLSSGHIVKLEPARSEIAKMEIEYHAHFRPSTAEESRLIHTMAASHWKGMYGFRLETAILNEEIAKLDPELPEQMRNALAFRARLDQIMEISDISERVQTEGHDALERLLRIQENRRKEHTAIPAAAKRS